MTLLDEQRLAFAPGSTGWRVEDFDDPRWQHAWDDGHFELVNGVLTLMPPALFDGCMPSGRLVALLIQHFGRTNSDAFVVAEPDVVIDSDRVLRPDHAVVNGEIVARQKAWQESNRPDDEAEYGRLRIPPILIIETLSRGHEDHDRVLKRKWYAEFGVPNYWLLDPLMKRLDCLVLKGDKFLDDAAGERDAVVKPSCFPGLVIPMAELWK